jgi:hypothetical protein
MSLDVQKSYPHCVRIRKGLQMHWRSFVRLIEIALLAASAAGANTAVAVSPTQSDPLPATVQTDYLIAATQRDPVMKALSSTRSAAFISALTQTPYVISTG